MILDIVQAEYIRDYKISLTFSNGEMGIVDLEQTLLNDTRSIFIPLRNKAYFKNFKISLNTITWDNEADFAPEFLLDLAKKQEIIQKSFSLSNDR